MLAVKIICTALAGIVGGVGGGGLVVAGWFVVAMGERDPSAGGAYVAMAMLTSPIGIVAGAIAAGIFCWSSMR